MLQINVAGLLKANIGTARDYVIEDTIEIAGSHRVVLGEVNLMRTDRSILVKGTLHTDIDLTCSRCLSQFSLRLTLDIEEEYFPRIDIYTGNALPALEDSEAFTIDEQNMLDLTEAVRQYALLSVPMKPLCRADCAGLCSVCGRNLNQGPCDCPPMPADPRWAKLSQLIQSDHETSEKERKGMK
ncbi:MAG: DUF177 domain-containing protein [Chloroflexi bacterium]|nr:DUF177 domain-containing protein [Chloroflexota bacterium]